MGFCSFCSFLLHLYVKVLKSYKGQPTNRGSSFQQKTLFPEMPRQSSRPLIPRLCDITLLHRSRSCIIYACWLVWHVRIDSTKLLCLLLVMLARACVSRPIRADWMFRRRGLNKTGAKARGFRRRGNTHWIV